MSASGKDRRGGAGPLPAEVQVAAKDVAAGTEWGLPSSNGNPAGTPSSSVAEAYELADAPQTHAGKATQQLATIAALTAENGELKDQALRLAADLENFRKRARREQDDIRRYGIDRLLNDMLPVVDNLARALSHAEGQTDPVIAGVRMVAKHFGDVLASHGVVGFDSIHTPFDPAKHEAVSEQPTHNVAPGTILQELERGYMIHTRLLRAARVVVATAAP